MARLEREGHGFAEVGGVAGRDGFVAAGLALLLGGLVGEQVAAARGAAHELAATGDFEALDDGFLGFLHGGSRERDSLKGSKKPERGWVVKGKAGG